MGAVLGLTALDLIAAPNPQLFDVSPLSDGRYPSHIPSL